MERKLWEALYRAVRDARHPCPAAKVSHSDRWALLVYLWAVVNDRPRCWACDPGNWPGGLGPARLPSPATLSRRLRSRPVRLLLNALLRDARGEPAADWVKYVDSKPLPVGDFTKD